MDWFGYWIRYDFKHQWVFKFWEDLLREAKVVVTMIDIAYVGPNWFWIWLTLQVLHLRGNICSTCVRNIYWTLWLFGFSVLVHMWECPPCCRSGVCPATAVISTDISATLGLLLSHPQLCLKARLRNRCMPMCQCVWHSQVWSAATLQPSFVD